MPGNLHVQMRPQLRHSFVVYLAFCVYLVVISCGDDLPTPWPALLHVLLRVLRVFQAFGAIFFASNGEAPA